MRCAPEMRGKDIAAVQMMSTAIGRLRILSHSNHQTFLGARLALDQHTGGKTHLEPPLRWNHGGRRMRGNSLGQTFPHPKHWARSSHLKHGQDGGRLASLLTITPDQTSGITGDCAGR